MSDSPESQFPPYKECHDCGRVKRAKEFWKNQKSPDRLAYYCKECFGLRNADSYRRKLAKEGKEPVREYRRIGQEPDGMKYCPNCKEIKPVTEFGKNKAEKSGFTAYCLPCHNTVMREQRVKRDGSTRNFHLKRRYGLTEVEVEEMIAKQGGKCMICRVAKAEHVDHDHKTGKVRGILCFNCNGGLGQFKDHWDVMARAIAYLKGTLPRLPVEERITNGKVEVVMSRLEREIEIRLAEDYAHS